MENEMNKKPQYEAIWRRSPVETFGFPKLSLNDNRVTGSITVRETRLPLWAIISTAICEGWEQVKRGWDIEEHYGYTKEDLTHFLYCLLEQRGEFGRLLMLLARVEDIETDMVAWWEKPSSRKRVIKQLQRCLDTLNEIDKDITLATPRERQMEAPEYRKVKK